MLGRKSSFIAGSALIQEASKDVNHSVPVHYMPRATRICK